MPQERNLFDFLMEWHNPSEAKLNSLLIIFREILHTIQIPRSVENMDQLKEAITEEIGLISSIINIQHDPVKQLLVKHENVLVALFDCPLCGVNHGERIKNNYFSQWELACGVQIANALYEVGIVIYAAVRSLPDWATPSYLGTIGKILEANRKSQESLDLMECPFCGRFTNALYGEGTSDNPHRCCWCFDNAGGIGAITMTLKTENASDDDFMIKYGDYYLFNKLLFEDTRVQIRN